MPILLFDGVCNLCHSGVRFVLKRDRHEVFTFAWVQSETGMNLCRQYGINPETENSFVLLNDGKAWMRSDAALEVCRLLGGGWKLLYVLRWIPRRWRDGMYAFVAARRYRWFGKKNSCERLPEKYRSRFMD